MNMAFLRAGRFWSGALIALAGIGLLFAYELNMLDMIGLAGPPRSMSHEWETVLAVIVALLFSTNIGLIAWHRQQGTCPIGVRRAAGLARGPGPVSPPCPLCLSVPNGIANRAA